MNIFYIILSVFITLFVSCNLSKENYQKELHDKTNKFADFDFPVKIDKSNIDNFYFYKIDDVDFIEKFIDTAYLAETVYSSVFKHAFNDEIDVLVWLKNNVDEKIMQLATYKNGILKSVINIAGYSLGANYSCEITVNFDISVVVEDVNAKNMFFYNIRQDGEVVISETIFEDKVVDISSFFKTEQLPYYSNDEILDYNFQELNVDEIEYFFGNSIVLSSLNTTNYNYHPFSYLEFNNGLRAYTFFVDGTNPHSNETKELIFISKDNVMLSYFDLFLSDVDKEVSAKVFENNNKIFFQYEKQDYEVFNYLTRAASFSVEIYELSASSSQLISAKMYDAYSVSSFDYLYNISKIKGDVPTNSFLQFCKVFDEPNVWGQKFVENEVSINSVAYFPLNDTTSGFIYYITDSMQNTIVFNKLTANRKVLDYQIIEDCVYGVCENFNFNDIYFGNKKYCYINSTHSAGKFPINVYCSLQNNELVYFRASAEDYLDYKTSNFYKYLFTLISDDEHEQMKITKDIDAILTDLKSVTPTNDILEMNISRLENY
ncbi:MAG: hypothetical protein JXR68_03105 [Bacteroidales bacterium]|nr:hypothetical protein [Bacteroidales bacterium]